MTLFDLSSEECPLLTETAGEKEVKEEEPPPRYVVRPTRSLESGFKDKV